MASARDLNKLLKVLSFIQKRIQFQPAQLSLWVKYSSETSFFWK